MQCNSLIVPTLKIEIMKTIKQIVFCVSLLLVMNCFYYCSNSNDVVINTQQNQEKTQDVEIQELIDFIETLNANKIQTRGPFWNRIKRFLVGDAWGYGWGVNKGLTPRGGLITAVVFSLICAASDDDLPRNWWHLSSNWKVYDAPLRPYEIIGNDHNKTIYNMMREDPVIANGTFSNYYLYNSTNKKLKSYGYTEEMPLLLQTRLLEIMDLVKKSTSVDQLMNLMKQEFPQRVSEFQLVESYINGLVNMDDKSTVRDYTKQVYAQIDASSLDVSAVSRLKTMIAIAENSKFLWVETK